MDKERAMHREETAASQYNYIPEVLGQTRFAEKIIINDTSTREGEQASDVSLGVEGKLALIRKLAEIGVQQVQGGYPGKSKSDRELVRRVREEGLDIKVEAIASLMFDNWREEVDACIDSGPDVLGLQYGASDIRLQYAHKVTRREMMARVVEGVRYAAGRGAVIKFSPTDTTRADLDFLKEVCSAALDAGAERIGVSDTAGAMAPAAMKYFVGEVVDALKVPIQLHCHNDFGLALANTLAGVEAGAQIVDTSVNGFGERAGNASLDEVVVALELFYGIDTGIEMEALKEVSELMAELTGIPVSPYKPLVGENAFAHKLDQHIKWMLINPRLYECIPPEAVGNKTKIAIGKYTGKFAIQYKLGQMGISASESDIAAVKEEIEVAAIRKKAGLTDAEFLAIVERVRSHG